MFQSTKSDNPCCKCCAPSDSHDDDGSTYKKAPNDGDVNGALINQPFQGFNSTTKLGMYKTCYCRELSHFFFVDPSI